MASESGPKSDGAGGGRSRRLSLFIGIVICLAVAKLFVDIARIINIWRNFDAYRAGFARGFGAVFTVGDWLSVRLILPVLALTVCLLAGGVAALVVSLALASFKRRRARVFISYQHAMLPDVEALERALTSAGFEPLVVPFRTAPEHDLLLDQIYAFVARADFVVCLPGPQPSFVEHEVASAIGQRKPLFILLPKDHRGAPNTAHHSYPALVLDSLRGSGFAELTRLIHYLHGDFAATLRLYLTPTSLPRSAGWLAPAVGLLLCAVAVSIVLPRVLGNLLEMARFNAAVDGFLFGVMVACVLSVGLAWLSFWLVAKAAIGGITAVRNRALAVRQTRRLLAEGRYSYEVLHALFEPTRGLLVLLAPFWKSAPRAYHEWPAAGGG